MNNERYDEEKAKKLENHYVHDVYSAQALSYDGLCDGPWPEIKKFLFNLQPGSFVADVGCGNGKYLTVRDDIVVHGVDICQELSQLAYHRHKNIIIANNLNLPFVSSTMDAVISVGVLHHFASYERRLKSVEELQRILKPGGKMLLYVWAWEQKQRKFNSQDVLIPWTLEKEKGEGNSGLVDHDIQSNNTCTKMTSACFQTNKSFEGQKETESEKEESGFKVRNGAIRNISNKQLSNGEEKQVNSSFIKSINNFTADLKETLQMLSFSKERKARSDDRRKADKSDYHQCYDRQIKYSRDGLITSVDDSEVLSFTYEQKQDERKQHETASFSDKTVSKCNDKTTHFLKCYNGSSESSQEEHFKRFYHVFMKDELSELVKNVRGLKVLTQYYDHGNWIVKAEKRKC